MLNWTTSNASFLGSVIPCNDWESERLRRPSLGGLNESHGAAAGLGLRNPGNTGEWCGPRGRRIGLRLLFKQTAADDCAINAPLLYAPRMQDGSEAISAGDQPTVETEGHLEARVEQLNAAIADVRRQLEDLGARD